MFGYILPDKPNMLLKEYALYRAHYCGMCKHIGKEYGQFPRLTTNYDAAFLSLFMHDYHDLKSELHMKGCAFHPFRKMAVLKKSTLTERLDAANILLAWYKARDDIADGGGMKKRAAAGLLKQAYKRAKKILPGADEIIKNSYERLRKLERENCPCPDKAADCFASMLKDLANLLGEGAARHNDPGQREALGEFFYHLGRWVYFADALDDIDEDKKAKRYNPFIFAGFGRGEDSKGDLKLYFYPSQNRMTELLEKFNFRMSENLLQNIVFYGISNMIEKLLGAEKKLKRIKI